MIGTGDGTKSSSLADFIYGVADVISTSRIDIGLKRSLWRGKYLGNYVTDEQYKAIGNGTFKDLFLGDYWEINGYTWRIMDFDYWWGTGTVELPIGKCYTRHLTIMPDQTLLDHGMNSSNSTVGGYYNSVMKKDILPNQVRPIVESAFGSDHLLRYAEHFTTGVTDGYPSTSAWFETNMDLPNDLMILGTTYKTPLSNGNISIRNDTTSAAQLAACAVNLHTICPQRWYWLRDLWGSSMFLYIGDTRTEHWVAASTSVGIRPVFGIKA